MNERDRIELERLKQRQMALLAESTALGRRLAELEARVAAEPTVIVPQAEPAPAAPPPLPPVIPPVISTPAPPALEVSQQEIPALEPVPIKLPPILEPVAHAPQSEEFVAPASAPEPRSEPTPTFARSQAAPPPIKPAAPPLKKDSSFEMRLGTYWAPRIGIVIVLTALVFIANYAYQNYIGRSGPGVKVALLYLVSGGLLAVGTWLQRKPELKNYGQVLQAGGLAAVYFTTYAAHHIPRLMIIPNAVLDGALLLGWAGFIIWLADRKKSEVLALFAVLLAYYSSIITEAGLFTLYSNLVLTAAAVFFLVRNRWATLSFASLVATYASYGFWRFYHQGVWDWVTPNSEGFRAGIYFLAAYWTLFTGAVFLSRNERFVGNRRTSFVSLNNAAFFSAFIFTMWEVHEHGFWKFALIYGSALMALWLLARRFLSADRLCQNAYLTQGLLLVTLGFVTHLTGFKLSLVLTVESVMLAILGQQMKSRVMRVASLIAGVLAVGCGMWFLKSFNRDDLIKGAAIGAAMLFNAFWLGRRDSYEQSRIQPRTILYTLLGLGMWLFTTWQNTHDEWRGLALAIETLTFLLACRCIGNQVLQDGAYGFALIATGWEVFTLENQYTLQAIDTRVGLAPAIIIGALMILGALWERRRALPTSDEKPFTGSVTFFCSLGLLVWLVASWVFTPREYLAPLLAGEALLLTASFYILRLKELPLLGQSFLILAQGVWLVDSFGERLGRPWWNATAVIVITLAIAQWWQRQKTLQLKLPVHLWLQGLYALAIIGLLYFWLHPHFEAPTWPAFASALAILLTAYAVINRFWFLALAGQIFVLVSSWEFISQLWDGKPEWYLPLAPIATVCLLSLLAIKWFTARPDAKPEIREAILQIGQIYRVVAVAMSLWWVHKYIPAQQVCWVLAAIGAGLFALAGWRRNRELLIFSTVFTLVSIGRFWVPVEEAARVYVPNLLAILTLLAQQRCMRRLNDRYQAPEQAHIAAMVLGGLSLWFFISRWIAERPEGAYLTLTAGWSILALILFVVGMSLRERIYRWLGLAILAGALGRVVFVDVWRLETIYRILSFMALGMVLLVLGFIYNKYQEKIKEWL